MTIIQRMNVDDPGQIQVRLNAIGFLHDDNRGGRKMNLAFLQIHGWLFAAFGAGVIAFVFHRGWMESIQFWIWFPFALVVLIALVVGKWSYRRELSRLPDYVIADRAAGRVSPVPWERLSRYSIEPTKDATTHRLRIGRATWLQVIFFVDSEVRCTAEQAVQLRKWMDDRLMINRGCAGRTKC